jgi:hypothetical protein
MLKTTYNSSGVKITYPEKHLATFISNTIYDVNKYTHTPQ